MVALSTSIASSIAHVLLLMLTHYFLFPLLQIPKSREVKIEAIVLINCSITESTEYTWKIFNASSGQALEEDKEIHDPVLYLPPRYLPYGDYTVEIQV